MQVNKNMFALIYFLTKIKIMRKLHKKGAHSFSVGVAAGSALLLLVLAPVSSAYLFESSAFGPNDGGGFPSADGGMQGPMMQGPQNQGPMMNTAQFERKAKKALATVDKSEKKYKSLLYPIVKGEQADAFAVCDDKSTPKSQANCYLSLSRKVVTALNPICRVGDIFEGAGCDEADAIRLAAQDLDPETLDTSDLMTAINDASNVFADARDTAAQNREEVKAAELERKTAQEEMKQKQKEQREQQQEQQKQMQEQKKQMQQEQKDQRDNQMRPSTDNKGMIDPSFTPRNEQSGLLDGMKNYFQNMMQGDDKLKMPPANQQMMNPSAPAYNKFDQFNGPMNQPPMNQQPMYKPTSDSTSGDGTTTAPANTSTAGN